MPDWVCSTCGELTGDGRGGDGPPSFCRCQRGPQGEALTRSEVLARGVEEVRAINTMVQDLITGVNRVDRELRGVMQASARQAPAPAAIACPLCGSTNIESVRVAESIAVPLGPEVFYEAFRDTCNSCNEQGDFNVRNAPFVEAAYLESGVRFVREALQEMEASMPLVSIDRCLRLKIGTARKWRDGDMITREAVALVQIIKTFPWMLDVADFDYTEEAADEALREYLREHLLID